jgi:hypothetical protein
MGGLNNKILIISCRDLAQLKSAAFAAAGQAHTAGDGPLLSFTLLIPVAFGTAVAFS